MRKIGQTLRFLIPVIALVALVVFMTGAGRRKRAKEAFLAAVAPVYEAWNTGNADLLDEVYAPDCLFHWPPYPDTEGLEAHKQFLAAVRSAFPDFQLTMDQAMLDGDLGLTRWTWRGTHTGEFFGLPPTGKRVVVSGCTIGQWVEGKVVEEWKYSDELGAHQQLGFKVIPPGE